MKKAAVYPRLSYKEWLSAKKNGIILNWAYDSKTDTLDEYADYKVECERRKMSEKYKNLEGDATVGQRIALHFATGLDTREWGITKQEASDAISALKAAKESKTKTLALVKPLKVKYGKVKAKANSK